MRGLYIDEKTGELFMHGAGVDSILRILEVAFEGEIFKDASAVNLMLVW